MNFQNQYKNDMDKIVPDEQFKQRLSDLMEEQAVKKRSGITFAKAFISVAACGAIVFAAVKLTGSNKSSSISVADSGLSSSQTDTNIKINANTDVTDSLNYNTGLFKENNSIFDSVAADKIPYTFAQMLADSGSLMNLYQSSTNDFSDENRVGTDMLKELTQKISSAELTENADSGEVVYYMAQFSDATIIKFTVTADSILKFSDSKNYYRFK